MTNDLLTALQIGITTRMISFVLSLMSVFLVVIVLIECNHYPARKFKLVFNFLFGIACLFIGVGGVYGVISLEFIFPITIIIGGLVARQYSELFINFIRRK